MTRKEILRYIARPLIPIYGRREADSIALVAVTSLTGIDRNALLIDPDAELEIDRLDQIVDRLAEGCPVQYVAGFTEFYGRRFAVREGVLIPRPETEELVHTIIRRERDGIRLLDVGTGSGCIACTLSLEMPRAEVFAADLSPKALEIAAENALSLGARVTMRQADALHNLPEVFPERFDAIVSNPPYVPQSDLEGMDRNVRDYEPHEALFVPDDDPLIFYRSIARFGSGMLTEGGRLYFEIYHLFATQTAAMLSEEGYTDIEILRDLFDKPRMICCRRK